MYSETDYLNYTDLNNIENRVKQINEKIKIYNSSIPDFSKKVWKLNDFPYIQEIQRIETGIDNFQKYWYKPDGWINAKVWLTGDENEQVRKSFSNIDINRWINNMNLIEKTIGDNTTIWNVQSYIYWNEQSDVDWEE